MCFDAAVWQRAALVAAVGSLLMPRGAAADRPSEYVCGAGGTPDTESEQCLCPAGKKPKRTAKNVATCVPTRRAPPEPRQKMLPLVVPAQSARPGAQPKNLPPPAPARPAQSENLPPPVLALPLDGAEQVSREPRLVVRAPAWAHGIVVDLCSDDECRRSLLTIPELPVLKSHSIALPSALPPRTTLFWRATGVRNGKPQGRSSRVQRFTTVGGGALRSQALLVVQTRQPRLRKSGERAKKTAPRAMEFPVSRNRSIHGALIEAARGHPPFHDTAILDIAVVEDWDRIAGGAGGSAERQLVAAVAVYDPQNLKCWLWDAVLFVRRPDRTIQLRGANERQLREIDCRLIGY